MKTNLPDNIWNAPVIRKRLFNEAGFECAHGLPVKQHYWFIVPDVDNLRNAIEIKNFAPSPVDSAPAPSQQTMARELQQWLQKEEHYSGLWIVGWTHPPEFDPIILDQQDKFWKRLTMIWLDEDGDPKFTVESDMPFIEMMENGPDYYLGLAAQGYAQWNAEFGKKAMKDDFGIKEEQTTKAALASMH